MYGIFIYIWLIFMGFHVGKYTSPMDPMGMLYISPRLWINRDLALTKLEISQVEEEGPYRWEASKLITSEIDRMDMAVSKNRGITNPKMDGI